MNVIFPLSIYLFILIIWGEWEGQREGENPEQASRPVQRLTRVSM